MGSEIHFRGSRAEARAIVRRLALLLAGRAPDERHVARGVFLTLGFAALADIQEDFLRKARGGTGEDGVKWPPLSPRTLAYSRRFGRGEQARLKRAAGLAAHHRFAPGGAKGLLSAAQLKRWKQIYGTRLARLLVSMPEPQAKARAAQIAWATLKREGAKTMLETYGHRQAEILRDTGVLFNSLSPGQLSGEGQHASYSKPTSAGGAEQVFTTLENGVIVGTNVPYAAAHQHGDAKRGIPARPFLPTGEAPEVWRQRWLDAGLRAVEAGARALFGAA